MPRHASAPAFEPALAPFTGHEVARTVPRHWELLAGDDLLEGPCAAVADLLRMLNLVATMRGVRRPPLGWQWTSMAGRALPSRSGAGRRVAKPDVVVMPGWHARNGPHLDRLVARDQTGAARLAAVHAGGGQVLALYTGVALAGAAGLLEGRPAAVPWPFVQSVLRHAPTLQLAEGRAWVGDGGVWSADSPALVSEAALALLQAGGDAVLAALAESLRSVMLHSPERQRLAGAIVPDARTRVGLGSLERARRWLEERLHEPYSAAATALAAGMSERSMLRHFQAAFGSTPLQLLHGLRVMRARMLLETSYLPLETVAERCGWRDPAMLREVFRRATGLTPAAYRTRYRLRTQRRAWGKEM